jgi:trigger factor
MSDRDDELEAGAEQPESEEPESEETEAAEASADFRMSLGVDIQDAGPCRKHVRIRIPQDDIDRYRDDVLGEFASSAAVPGFRVGHVPKSLVARRFRVELADKVKQKVLVDSLEQLANDADLDPINEPHLDVENIQIPDEGDFEYEFDVEVRPEFELPDYRGLPIRRPVGGVSDADVDAYQGRFLAQYGQLSVKDGAAEPGDYVTVSVEFARGGAHLWSISEMSVRLLPVLRFQDAEVEGFDQLLAGATAGDRRETDVVVSAEAESLELRGETVHVVFTVASVKTMELPDLNKEFLQSIGVDSEEELRDEIRQILERQMVYQQRQTTRTQVMEKITESADWDLPEDLVRKQVENALRREVLEMQQAGFTSREIRSRENEIRQRSVSTTRQALKEHFVLDRIAEEEDIEVTSSDLDIEIRLMALQSGESPRRVRARLVKTGMIENLEAQIRERKAVDVILSHAVYEDVEMEAPIESSVEAVAHSVCGSMPAGASVEAVESGAAEG